jgi:hypothetical protein
LGVLGFNSEPCRGSTTWAMAPSPLLRQSHTMSSGLASTREHPALACWVLGLQAWSTVPKRFAV